MGAGGAESCNAAENVLGRGGKKGGNRVVKSNKDSRWSKNAHILSKRES